MFILLNLLLGILRLQMHYRFVSGMQIPSNSFVSGWFTGTLGYPLLTRFVYRGWAVPLLDKMYYTIFCVWFPLLIFRCTFSVAATILISVVASVGLRAPVAFLNQIIFKLQGGR